MEPTVALWFRGQDARVAELREHAVKLAHGEFPLKLGHESGPEFERLVWPVSERGENPLAEPIEFGTFHWHVVTSIQWL